jgi:glycerol uptake facilitator-like aquaporin
MPESRKLAAELIGTAFLVCAVIGSGIMAERLAGGNAAIALLANTIATAAALFVLITAFAPVSGAHFNPMVSFSSSLSWTDAAAYSAVQIIGGLLGTGTADLMFGLPAYFPSQKMRTGFDQWLGEIVATFGLIGIIIAVSRSQKNVSIIAAAVASYIAAAYWFTSSTSFANPAVTIARSLSDTFTGIRPVDVPTFIAAQIVAGSAAAIIFNFLFPKQIND